VGHLKRLRRALDVLPANRSIRLIHSDFFVPRGYVHVLANCRGTSGSGYDLVEWEAKQPWSDGNIGMVVGRLDGGAEDSPSSKCDRLTFLPNPRPSHVPQRRYALKLDSRP
jgi:hypothetical protein